MFDVWCSQAMVFKLSWVLLTKIRQPDCHGADWKQSGSQTGWRVPSGQETPSLCVALNPASCVFGFS